MLQAIHIATRGRLDGEYGIATRGFIICPDIVVRFPSIAEITLDEALMVTIKELGLEATLRGLDLVASGKELSTGATLRPLGLFGNIKDEAPNC